MRIFFVPVLLLGFIFLSILLGGMVFEKLYSYPKEFSFGVTFSPGYARYLKLDWQKTYIAMLDDLKVRNLRIQSYWDILEPKEGKYDFSETDYMLSEANKKGAGVMLVLGERQPRWPECHIPTWAKGLSIKDRQQKILEFIQKVVERYQDQPVVRAWQVENEPMLGGFGEGCGVPDKNFLQKEAELVRNLSKKTIIMTDSGELGFWIIPAQLSDVFGTTLYRKVNDKYLGYVTYPLLPYFYSIKSNLARIFAPNSKKTIIVELQAEPWLAGGTLVSPKEQAKLFTAEDFKNYTNFAKKTGFDEAYLWGVEWWYFMAENGYPEYLEYAKTLF